MKAFAPLVLVLAFAAAGCGKSEAEKERESEAKSGRGTVTCSGSATSEPTKLPAGFPSVSGVTFVSAKQQGPTRVVDGYANRGLKELYDEFQSGFGDAGYAVLFHEREEDDAEVSYRTKDKASEGQVALRSCDEDKTSVHITVRPA